MRKLLDSVCEVCKEELERANGKNPLFHSDHEAYGVIGEELWEVMQEFKSVSKHFDSFRDGTFTDNEEQKCEALANLYGAAIMCAAEMIQVAAMADKAIDSKGVI